MSPVRVTTLRTLARMFRSPLSALGVALFLGTVFARFLFALEAAEGTVTSAVSVAALVLTQALPLLVAFLGMGVWSEEIRSGYLALLLSSPVSERELTAGKFLGLWLMVLFALVLTLLAAALVLGTYLVVDWRELVVLLALLVLQAGFWSAVSVTASAFFSSSVAAFAAVAVGWGLPRALWAAAVTWAPELGRRLGDFPIDVNAVAVVTGEVSMAMVAGYLAFALAALFVAVRRLRSYRYVGSGTQFRRLVLHFEMALAAVSAVLLTALVWRLNQPLLLPLGKELVFSQRTRDAIMGVRGDLRAICVLPRSDPRFREAERLLRAFRREFSQLGGGPRLEVEFVDPNWDLHEARRLAAAGVAMPALVLVEGRRRVVKSLAGALDERVLAEGLMELSRSPGQHNVYWTQGHGESSFVDDGQFGLSEIARDIEREGYGNRRLDLSEERQIPGDCAVIAVAGAREDFSRSELARLDSFLTAGGRLLVMLAASESGGVVTQLPRWGVRPLEPTVAAGELYASDFPEHPVTHPLAGSRLVLERPVPLVEAPAVSGEVPLAFSPLVRVGADCVAAAVERGAAAADLNLRPMRLVVLGDALMVLNARLAVGANANRDFFLNCLAYLTGEAIAGAGPQAAVLATGWSREERQRLFMLGTLACPLVVILVLLLPAVGRRRRRN